jgi:large subunit ribosomal protein L17
MRKHIFGRHLKRDTNERKALFKNLLTSLVIEERITTTEAKAKAIKAAADKLVTKAKKGGPDALRSLAPDVRYDAVTKLVNTIAPRFVDRQGGYTRIIKAGYRVADNAPQVVMEWVVMAEPYDATQTKKIKGNAKDKNEKSQGKNNKETVDQEVAVNVKPKRGAQPSKPTEKGSILKKFVTRQKKG